MSERGGGGILICPSFLYTAGEKEEGGREGHTGPARKKLFGGQNTSSPSEIGTVRNVPALYAVYRGGGPVVLKCSSQGS